jgi:hypothetical protein
LLAPELTPQVAQEFAARLAARFRARFAASPAPGRTTLVFAPDAAAVLLHEAVAHALEVDILAQSGNPEAAVGVALGARCLNVLDSPGAAPEAVRRSSDDEGVAVPAPLALARRVVEQPLADGAWPTLRPCCFRERRGEPTATRFPGRDRPIWSSSRVRRAKRICSPRRKAACGSLKSSRARSTR